MKPLIIVGVLLFVPGARAQEPRLATLAQQKMCADQARKAFNESDASKPINDKKFRRVSPAEYTSHYDAKANVCYIMVHESNILDDAKGNANSKIISISKIVYDAFEGRVYANYLWMSEKGKKFWEVAPMECNVKPRGQDEITCKSSEEFDRLVDKHFGIGL
jgi:hypothetical protein